MMKRRGVVAIGVAALSLLVAVPVAQGHPEPSSDGGISDDGDRDAHQHGDSSGHLAASSANVELVSKLELKNVAPGKIADVGVLNGYAYLAAWGVETCQYNGVHVVDIRDPKAPDEVAFIQSKEGSYPGEGVQALSISTPKFTGDILVTNNEKCKDKVGFGGLNIYDVTNPAHPTPLVEGLGDSTVNGQGKKNANEIHSVFAWDAGNAAYAVIVDNEEGADVDIIDITDPKNARLIAEYDLDVMFPKIVQATPANLVEVFHHDVIVKEIDRKQVMSVSYWDGGYVLLDMTNPLQPALLADSDFPNPDTEPLLSGFKVAPEGNAHQSEFTSDNKFLIGADEDFAPYALVASNTTDGTPLNASTGNETRQLDEGASLTGTAVFVGRACSIDTAVLAGSTGSQIAVVERGECSFSEKVANVIKAGGYEGVLIFNRTGSDACGQSLGMDVEGDLPTFGVAPRGQGFAIFNQPYEEAACLAGTGPAALPVAIGTIGDKLSFAVKFDGWGYVRLFRRPTVTGTVPGKLKQLDTYAVPEAHNPEFASGFGDLSVHEVATSPTRPDLAYLSYYSAGFRVVKVVKDKLVEVGHFIDDTGELGNNFWGVQVFQSGGVEYVAASDRDFGLYIFRYTGG